MGKPSAPTPPDPRETSQAQTGTNIGTSIANTIMGQVNQVGPTGSLSYDRTGSFDWTDPYTNQTYQVPTFTATTSMSPEMQRVYQGLTDQAGRVIGNMDASPLPDVEGIRSQAQDALIQRMQPMWDQDRQANEARMAAQGIGVGSRAYASAQGNVERNINDARLGAVLGSGDEAARMFQMETARRAQPINEITALLSGSQVATPNFGMSQPTPIPFVDNAGLINANYNQRFNAYNQQMGQWNNTMGGLFGMGAALLSDERAKEDVQRVGETDEGLPIYTYRYKGGGPKQMGVMAQDVQKENPRAVRRMGELLAVDYGKVR